MIHGTPARIDFALCLLHGSARLLSFIFARETHVAVTTIAFQNVRDPVLHKHAGEFPVGTIRSSGVPIEERRPKVHQPCRDLLGPIAVHLPSDRCRRDPYHLYLDCHPLMNGRMFLRTLGRCGVQDFDDLHALGIAERSFSVCTLTNRTNPRFPRMAAIKERWR